MVLIEFEIIAGLTRFIADHFNQSLIISVLNTGADRGGNNLQNSGFGIDAGNFLQGIGTVRTNHQRHFIALGDVDRHHLRRGYGNTVIALVIDHD